MLDQKANSLQWYRLLAITAVHFFVDTFGGMYPAILPAVRTDFGWTLAAGSWILFVLTITCNAGQVICGHLRPNKSNPLFMQAGMLLSTAICFLFLFKNVGGGFWIILVFAFVTGAGISITHPEGLRAVHALDRIPSSISTAIFMTGGFLGFACGGWIGTSLVSRFGLEGLLGFLAFPPLAILLIHALNVRLAVENKKAKDNADEQKTRNISFWAILVMAIGSATASTVIVYLLPTRLNELGFELTFGGWSTMLFGFGGAGGALLWALLAYRKGEMFCAIVSLLLGVPFLAVYMFTMASRHAIWLLPVAGFCSLSAYPLMVSMARKAKGFSLGGRMGIVVGGTWGIAGIIEMLLVLAEKQWNFGVEQIVKYAPAGYLFSAAVGIYIMLHQRTVRKND